MSNPTEGRPGAYVFGCAGPELLADEAEFFADAKPFGFILFARNCISPDQVAKLTRDLRACIGRPDAAVLIDEEGGRVQRLRPPQWRDTPAAARFGELAAVDAEKAATACRLNARLIADDLTPIGINVDCLPCLDLFHAPGSPAIGSRSFSHDPELVALLGRAQVDGLRSGGVLPIMKHMPGHGRALVDSHYELPQLDIDLDSLRRSDFHPFQALADLPMGMTAHIVVKAIDPVWPATQSPDVIRALIRGEIGFSGILFSDDIGMHALSGGFAERTERALQAGCDLVLHCSGTMDEMREVARVGSRISERAWTQWLSARSGLAGARGEGEVFDRAAALASLAEFLDETAAG